MRHTWRQELNDVIRGASGGFLFGTPLLYTMEVWWIGSSASPMRVLLALVFSFAVIFMLNRTCGFRQSSTVGAVDAAIESVEALAIGIVCAGIILVLLREIRLDSPLNEWLGKLVYESVPFTLGVALANQLLSKGDEDEDEAPRDRTLLTKHHPITQATLADIGSTLVGALIIAFSIAPTDEIPMVASAVSGGWLLAIMLASLLISYAIVFAAGFGNQQKRRQQQGIFQRPISETVVSYLVSLGAALLMLLFFDRISLSDPLSMWLSHTILLGLPATVGGAAGRLAV